MLARLRRGGLEQGGEVARAERRRMIVEDAGALPGMDEGDRAALRAEGVMAMQCTPMISRSGEVVGVLGTQFREARRPGDAELRLVDLLVVNEGELSALVGTDSSGPAGGLRRAQARGPRTVVVTLGARGCLARQGGDTFAQAAPPVVSRDTTGAGDTFVGVLAAQLSAGAPFQVALRWATTAGALACTRAGAQPAMPTRAEIEAGLRRWPQP